MAKQKIIIGSRGSFLYDDDKDYPTPDIIGTPFSKQIASLWQGAVGMMDREPSGGSIGYVEEIHSPPTLDDQATYKFNQRILDANRSMVKVFFLNINAYAKVLLQNDAAGDPTIIDITLDARNDFGTSSGADRFNIYLDSNDEPVLENNDGAQVEPLIHEESWSSVNFTTP